MSASKRIDKMITDLGDWRGERLAEIRKLVHEWRAIDFHEEDKIDKTAFKALLRAAVKYNTTHSVPKSRGSRK